MKLIMKYLKPHVLVVLLCIACLFGQVVCDLTLPNLMSDIVNVGIQQGGLEEEAPKAISENGMKLLEFFMTGEEKQLMESGYQYVLPRSSEAQRHAKEYPLAESEPVYIRTADDVELDGITRLYGKSTYALMEYLKSMGDLQGGAAGGLTGDMQGSQFGGQMPDGQMPDGQFDAGQMPGDGDQLIGGYSDAELSSGYDEDQSAFSESMDDAEARGELARRAESEVSRLEEESGADSEKDGEEAAEGFADMDITELYAIIPMMEQMPSETFRDAAELADNAEETMQAQVGVTFTRLFYNEAGVDTAAIQSDYIWKTGVKMIGFALLTVAAAVTLGLFSSRIAAKVARSLRSDLFRKVEGFSSAEYDDFSTASLITRTTNDVQQVQMLVTMGLRMLCYAPMMGAGSIIFALQKGPSLSWIIVMTVVVLLGIMMIILAVVMPKFKILQKLTDKLNLVSRESLSGMMVIRAFGNEKHEEERFDKANKDLTDTNMFIQRLMAVVMPSMTFMMNLATLLIIWFGANAIADATLQIGDMMAFIQYAMQVIISFLMIAMMFVFVPRALVSAKRIADVLNTKDKIVDPKTPTELKTVKGTVRFDDVYFKYEGAEEYVLEDISFAAKPGETTAFIGSTGSGKSTLINLIPRFYDVTEGSISVDGVDVREMTQKNLRANIGYIPQQGLLFSGTIASNLEYGKENATEEEMHHALKIAQAEDFVYSEESGTALPVAQGGTSVSGGQRQRLSIARALMKRAPIYIFDDSFSALDFKTDANLRKALKKDTADATVLIVAQRVSTILYAEQIIVLDKGRIVGKGTHKELLKSCPEYREIAESQMAKEELQ